MISAFILIAIIVAVLVRAREPASAAALPAKVAIATDRPTGSSGGTLLTSGALSIEVSMSEKDGDARLVVLPFVDGKRATKNVSVTGSLGRYDGTRQPLSFAADAASRFTTSTAIARPHVFDAMIAVTASGRSASFTFSQADGAIALNAQQIKASRIEISRAGPAQVVDRLRLPGEIRLDEDHTAHVVPRVAGIVERVDVSIGQSVKQGQLLAVISSPDLADRRSELLAAQRRLSAARTTYERERSLWQERISAEQDYLQAQAALREAEVAVRNAQQKLRAIGATGTSSGNLNRYEIRAPFDGIVVEKHLGLGEAVREDANAFLISDLSSVWAEIIVSPKDMQVVRIGEKVVVRATAFDASAEGKISYVGSLIGEQSRTAKAHVVLPNTGDLWRPGLFVNVEVVSAETQVPVAVAADAIQTVEGRNVVFVRDADGFVAKAVSLGRSDGKSVEITSGLDAGTGYAATGSFAIKAELGKGSAEHSH